jgi:prolyl-tRNA synthetase
MIRQTASGIYAWLPLGLRVLKKIEQIIREEQEKVGALEMLLPIIQSAEPWKESGRYDDYGEEMLKIKDRHGRDILFGPTAEEIMTQIFANGVKSYRDSSKILYNIQWKFRDEIRPRFGVMRGREFLMKDGYSFDLDEQEAKHSYNKMFLSYLRIFRRLGIHCVPVKADTGPIGGDLSHEFVMIAPEGETEIYYHEQCIGNILPDNTDDPKQLQEFIDGLLKKYSAFAENHDAKAMEENFYIANSKGIEVGHIFYFGDKYSKALNCQLQDKNGKMINPLMGSYGIGVSRLVAAIIEDRDNHTEDAILWPEVVAPYKVGIINIRSDDEACRNMSEKLYREFVHRNVEVIYDDRDERAGVKFASMDLIGPSFQVIIGPKALSEGLFEMKIKRLQSGEKLSYEDLVTFITAWR